MDINNFIKLLPILLGLFFILKKFELFIDNVNFSEHKKIGILNKSPVVLGGIYLTIVIIFFSSENYNYLKIICTLVLILGFLSDRNYLKSPTTRFALQLFIMLIFVYVDQISIQTISIDFFDKILEFEMFNIFFTLFCLTILMNGSNFLDGLNGLVSGYYLLIFCSLIYLNINSDLLIFRNLELINLIFTALILFFFLNMLGLVYLGDSGSYIISIVVGYILILETQYNPSISPYYIAIILWYPAFENLFSLTRRLINKNNISEADKLHLHHLIFRYLKHKKFMNVNFLNPVTSLIILISNIPLFIFATLNYSHTVTLVAAIISYVFIYLLVYFYLIIFFRKIL